MLNSLIDNLRKIFFFLHNAKLFPKEGIGLFLAWVGINLIIWSTSVNQIITKVSGSSKMLWFYMEGEISPRSFLLYLLPWSQVYNNEVFKLVLNMMNLPQGAQNISTYTASNISADVNNACKDIELLNN